MNNTARQRAAAAMKAWPGPYHDGKTAAQYVARITHVYPGGDATFTIQDDGLFLCPACVRENYRWIAWANRHKIDNGWRVIGWGHTGEMDVDLPYPLACAHCDTPLSEL